MRLLTATAVLAVSCHAAPIDADRMLLAISQIEGGRYGHLGGPCCLSETVWRQHSHLSYDLSRTPFFCIQVEHQHLAWIIESLQRAGIAVAPDTVYAAWRLGLTGAVRRIRAGSMPEACQRAMNLYYELR